MILACRVASVLKGVGISGDDSELRDATVQPSLAFLARHGFSFPPCGKINMAVFAEIEIL